MDFFNALRELKDASGAMAIEKGQEAYGSPGHGKPVDYGFGGRARNAPCDTTYGRWFIYECNSW